MEYILFKATLVAAVFSFFIILFTRKENSYLGTTGTAGTKKLMVVDQTSGAISFLNDSVEGVNQKFLQNDATQAALLQSLFGPDLDGEGGIFKAKMDERVAALETFHTGFAAGSTGYQMRVDLKGKIPFGWGIQLEASHDGKFKDGSSRYLGDDRCDNNYSSEEKARWCSSAPVQNTMRIKASHYQPSPD